MRPLILVTNDDGINSNGIKVLASILSELGDVVTVAPDRERSAVSHALTLHRPLKADYLDKDLISVNGTPTDCVALAVSKLLTQKPDLIASGINKGGNVGDDVTYSGTVSAAIEGTILNIPSFAVSMFGNPPFLFESAKEYVLMTARYILEKSLPYDTLLNVNVPNLPVSQIKGVRLTRQGKRIYDGSVKEVISPWGEKQYWLGGGQPFWERGDDMDIQSVMDGYVSITPIHLDMTNYEALSYLKKTWFNE